MPPRVFVDTWGWMALGYRKDPRHSEVGDYYQDLQIRKTQIKTSDYVLDELITLLFQRESYSVTVRFLEEIFAAAEQGYLAIEQITSARFVDAWKLRRRFKDKPDISFTDLTSMALMKESSIIHVLTDDDHFHKVGMGFQKVP